MAKPEFTFRYKIRNWREYNRALVRRGQLTLWFDEHAVAAWRDTTRSSEPGRPRVYANAAVECALILKSVFHLSLRAIQGFLASAVTFMGLELPVRDSTTSRRQVGLAVSRPPAPRTCARHIVVDSTGLKALQTMLRAISEMMPLVCARLFSAKPKPSRARVRRGFSTEAAREGDYMDEKAR